MIVFKVLGIDYIDCFNIFWSVCLNAFWLNLLDGWYVCPKHNLRNLHLHLQLQNTLQFSGLCPTVVGVYVIYDWKSLRKHLTAIAFLDICNNLLTWPICLSQSYFSKHKIVFSALDKPCNFSYDFCWFLIPPT